MKKILLLVSLLFAVYSSMQLHAQSPACTAAFLSPHVSTLQTSIDSTMQLPANETWFKVLGLSDSAILKTTTFITGHKNRVDKIELYKGTSCTSLTFIARDSIETPADSVLMVNGGNHNATDTLYIRLTYVNNPLCPSCIITDLDLHLELWYLASVQSSCPTCTTMTGCNLVCNGDFETNNGFTSTIAGNISDACGWTNLTTGSCDYFNAAFPPGFGVPCNVFGGEASYSGTGNGYAGFGSHPSNTQPYPNNTLYSEYMKTRLLYPLVPGNTYTVSLMLSLADYARLGSNTIGIYFFDSPSSIPSSVLNSSGLVPFSPSISINTSTVSKSGWTSFTYTYSPPAGSNFQWMAIGGFTTNWPVISCSDGTTPCSYTCNWETYMYVDNVSVAGLINIPRTYTGCAGRPSVLSSQLSGPWNWTGPFGFTATTQSVTATYTSAYSYTVTGTINGCAAREVFALNGIAPDQTITIAPGIPNGNGFIYNTCTGQPVTFTVSGLSNNNCTWYNGALTPGYYPPPNPPYVPLGTGSAFTYTPTTSQTLTAYGNTANGCGTQKSVTINVISPPAAVITGDLSMCAQSDFTDTYTAAPQSPGVTYTWSVTINGTNVPFTPSGNGQAITVDWSSYASGSSNAQICLTVSAPGCGDNSSCITVATCCIPSSSYKVISGSSDPNNPTLLDNTTLITAGAANSHASVALSGYFIIAPGMGVSWNDMRFAMAPDARITIPSGSALALQDCHFFGCSRMWDGLYVTGGALSFAKRNLFEDATNAVVIQNNTAVSFNNVIFNKCHIGIDIRTATAVWPGYIYNCIFTSRNFSLNPAGITMPVTYLGNAGLILNYPTNNYTFYPSANVLMPYLAGRAHIGVNIADHLEVDIGRQSTSASLRNIFDNLVYGIHGLNSNVLLLNNLFIYIQEQCSGGGFCIESFSLSTCPAGTAVCTGNTGTAHVPDPLLTSIGVPAAGSPIYPNYFENDQYGVYNSNNRDLLAQDNQFKIIDKVAIYNGLSSNYFHRGTTTHPSNILTVTGNVMDRAQTGVQFNDNRNAVMIINSNNFNWANWNTTTTQQSVNGIIVSNAVVHTVGSLSIGRNNLANLQKGITLTLQGYSGTGTANRVLLSDNQIGYNQFQTSGPTVQHYGIGIFSSKRITVDGDAIFGQIQRVTSSAATLNSSAIQRDLFNGVRIESSPESWITDMLITNLPAGIYAKGACATSDFWCNTFTGAYNGVYLDNANVGDQLNLASPYLYAATGNQWVSTNIAGSKIGGSASPSIIWYYNPSGNYNAAPLLGITSGITLTVATNTADACSLQMPEDPGDGDPNGRIMGSGANDPGTVIAGGTLAINGAISNNARFNEQPDLELYPAYLDSSGIESAGIYNASIITETDADMARKQVDEIHLRSWAQGIPFFSASDSSYLCQLATADPEIYSSAVYSAQVMIGECNLVQSNARLSYIQPEEIIPVSENKRKIYPNPNNGLMQADITLKESECGLLEIINLSGDKLSFYKLNPGSNSVTIDETKLQAGTYLYKITINGLETEIGKLIIIK